MAVQTKTKENKLNNFMSMCDGVGVMVDRECVSSLVGDRSLLQKRLDTGPFFKGSGLPCVYQQTHKYLPYIM